jgi:hypothetical protein
LRRDVDSRREWIRTNSASKKFEVLVTKFVGSFDSLAAAKKFT